MYKWRSESEAGKSVPAKEEAWKWNIDLKVMKRIRVDKDNEKVKSEFLRGERHTTLTTSHTQPSLSHCPWMSQLLLIQPLTSNHRPAPDYSTLLFYYSFICCKWSLYKCLREARSALGYSRESDTILVWSEVTLRRLCAGPQICHWNQEVTGKIRFLGGNTYRLFFFFVTITEVYFLDLEGNLTRGIMTTDLNVRVSYTPWNCISCCI